MTFPFLWLTSTSPSMLTTLEMLAVTLPCFASNFVRLPSNHCFVQAEASLLTQCQLFGLWSILQTRRAGSLASKWSAEFHWLHGKNAIVGGGHQSRSERPQHWFIKG